MAEAQAAPSFDEFPLAGAAPPKPETTGFEEFPVAAPSLSEKVGAVGQGATGAFVETAPVLGGMAAGAALGGLGGPAAPVTVPLGAAGGAIAGYFAGKKGREMLSDVPLPISGAPMTFKDVESLPPELRPYGVAGEVLGASVPIAAAPMAAASVGARLPASKVGNYINRIIDMAGRNPGTFAASEAAGATGAAVAGGVAEAYLPGNEAARAGAEIAGGFFNPTRLVVGATRRAVDAGMNAFKSLTPSGRETRAGQVLREILEAGGEDPDAVVALLREADLPGIQRTAAQKTGSPAIAALEAKLREDSAKFGADSAKMAEDSLAAIENMVVALRGTGDPAAVRAAADLRARYFRTLLAGRVQSAEREAVEAAAKITNDTPASRAALSRQAETALEQAMKDARAAEGELWAKVPTDTRANAGEIIATYDRLRGGMLPEEAMPPVVEGFITRMRSQQATTTSGEIMLFRSRALALAREAAGQGRANDARVFGNLAEAALDDMDRIAVGPLNADYEAARTFSRELNETFTRTFAGQSMATNARGADRIPPELMLRRALGSGGEAGALRMRELEEATAFMTEAGGAASQNLPVMLDAQQRMLRLAAADAVDPVTGRVSSTRIGKFIRDNEEMLNRFPEVRTDLEAAMNSEEGAKSIARMATGASREIEAKAAFSKVAAVENPADAIKTAVGSRNPTQDVVALVKLARRGGPDATAGLRAAVWDHAIQRATSSTGEVSLEKMQAAFFNPIRPKQSSLVQIMQREGVMSADDVSRLQKLFGEAEKITKALATETNLDQVLSGPDAMVDMVVRIAGARMGAGMSSAGSSLIAASRGSQFARDIFARVPNLRIQGLIIEAAENPRLFAALLKKPKTAAEKVTIGRQIHAYLLQAGLIDENDEGQGSPAPQTAP